MTADVIAWVTLAVLATRLATVILAWKTSNLAGSTEQMAKASVHGIALQREELEAVKDQLKLAREELESARSADCAKLQVDAGFARPTAIIGGVK